MAPTPPSSDEAAKQRILTHMNADHQPSLSLYVRHYCGLSIAAARSADLVDISLSSLSILAFPRSLLIFPTPTLFTIPITPPLASWADARTTVVAMDKEARRGLGISDTIDLGKSSYIPPTAPMHVVIFAAVLWFYFSLVMQALGYFAVGGWWYNNVLCYWPIGGAEMYLWIQKAIGIPALVVHVGETVWLAGKLRRFGVGQGRDTRAWWAWVASCFVEGFGAHQRFGGLVRRAEMEAERKRKDGRH